MTKIWLRSGLQRVENSLKALKTLKAFYVGITSREPEVRWKEHLHSNTPRATLNYQSVPNSFGLSILNGRIWEQNLINQYKLDILYNKINSISPSYWNLYNIK